jgi:hypothetical protein
VNCQHGISISIPCAQCGSKPAASAPPREPQVMCMVSMTSSQLDRALREFHEATTTPYERVLQEACERLYRMVRDHAPGCERAARAALDKSDAPPASDVYPSKP